MQHKGTRKGGGGLWKSLKSCIPGAVPGPVVKPPAWTTPPWGPGPWLPLWQGRTLLPGPPLHWLSSSDMAYMRACSQLWGEKEEGRVTSGCFNGALFPRPQSLGARSQARARGACVSVCCV